MLMGTQRNKLGNMVYYRRRGQELARARVSPANPRSERQARQRMNFGTLQQAKSRLAEIVNHSYQGVTYGDISLNHFTKLNVPILKYAAANPDLNAAYFLPKGVKALAPNEYIVSDGSLTQIPLDDNGNGVTIVGSLFTANLDGPDDYVEQLASVGFAPGDQLTAMCIVNTGSIIASTPAGDSIFDMQMVAKRIVFKTLDEITDWSGISSLWSALDSQGRMTVNPALLVADKSEEVIFGTTEPGQASGTVSVTFNKEAEAYGSSANVAASVVIRSSLVNGQWLRSPQKFLLNDGGESRPDVADVLSTYMNVETDPESPYYLNQSQARSAQASGIETVVTSVSSTYDSWDDQTKTWTGSGVENILNVNFNKDVAAADCGLVLISGDMAIIANSVIQQGSTSNSIKITQTNLQGEYYAHIKLVVYGESVLEFIAHIDIP